ncbi:hypothetical protein AAKU55_005921 [Oxalobacteraceae bacterium GrIS 1.11]
MPNYKKNIVASCLMLLSPLLVHAEMYKWVDAKGHTHYSDKQEEAGAAKVEAMKLTPQPTAAPMTASSTPDWRKQEEEFKRRQARVAQPSRPITTGKPVSMPGRNELETDSTRCDLARNIKNGAVRHTNNAPIDSNDREIAERDARAYCH